MPFAEVRPLIGKGGDKLLPEVSGIDAESPQGKAISKRRGEIFQAEFLPTLRPFPGASNLLARMKQAGLRLAVASSAKDDELKRLLRLCGADEFIEAETSSDDADNSKPDPDIVHAALGRLGQPADAVLMLGDTPYDVEAAGKAGVGVVARALRRLGRRRPGRGGARSTTTRPTCWPGSTSRRSPAGHRPQADRAGLLRLAYLTRTPKWLATGPSRRLVSLLCTDQSEAAGYAKRW